MLLCESYAGQARLCRQASAESWGFLFSCLLISSFLLTFAEAKVFNF